MSDQAREHAHRCAEAVPPNKGFVCTIIDKLDSSQSAQAKVVAAHTANERQRATTETLGGLAG